MNNYKIVITQINEHKIMRIELIDFTKKYIDKNNYSLYENIMSILQEDEKYIYEKIEEFDNAIMNEFDEILANNYLVMIDDSDDKVLRALQQRHTNLRICKSKLKSNINR